MPEDTEIQVINDLPKVWIEKILRMHMGGIIKFDDRNYILESTLDSIEKAELIGQRWMKDGYWKCIIINTKAEHGLGRVAPYFLLRTYLTREERERNCKQVNV